MKEILDFLYQEEKLNLHIIHYFQNEIEEIGDVYPIRENDVLTGIVHVRFDGNSNFTSFYATTDYALNEIARSIQNNPYPHQLLAGKLEEVKMIFETMGKSQEVQASGFYCWKSDKFRNKKVSTCTRLVKVIASEESHIRYMKACIIDFYGAETETEINHSTSDKKIENIIKNGAYLLWVNDQPVGMARFSGFTNQYIELTTVYIMPDHRGNGFGKLLMEMMISEAIKMNKQPVLQADLENTSAVKLYESLGFIKELDYSFQFI